MPLPTDAAYLAGLIDGDGSMGLYRIRDCHKDGRYGIPRYLPRLSISNTNIGLLERVQEVWGGNIYAAKSGYRPGNPVHRMQWQTQAGIVSILQSIKPYLILKSKQADELLDYCIRRINRSTHKAHYSECELLLAKSIKSYNFQKGGHVYASGS